jgi:putative addiction module component (TIGR02574 family)
MTPTVETVEAEALQLTPAERALLVERLIASLDADPEIEAAWAAEVERRHAEIESGDVTLLPGPETLAQLQRDVQSSRLDSLANQALRDHASDKTTPI